MSFASGVHDGKGMDVPLVVLEAMAEPLRAMPPDTPGHVPDWQKWSPLICMIASVVLAVGLFEVMRGSTRNEMASDLLSLVRVEVTTPVYSLFEIAVGT